MASNLTVDTLTKGATTLNTDELVDVNNTRVCKAWVNFNGTGVVAIRASYNVSSITDDGVGKYTVNFTIAMTDANYSVSGMTYDNANNVRVVSQDGTQVAGSRKITVNRPDNYAGFDSDQVSLTVFR
jgi:hypothetical protein